MQPRRFDLVAVIAGLLAVTTAGIVLWATRTSSGTFLFDRLAIPVALIAVGGLGLLASRR